MVCPVHEADIERGLLQTLPLKIEVVFGKVGSSAQRNVLIDEIDTDKIVLFLDDDFVMHEHYIRNCRLALEAHADVVLLTGEVIADGATGAGLTFEDADHYTALDRSKPLHDCLTDIYSGYGCNMAARVSLLKARSVRFDEALPLYGWLEDLDFSRQLARFGRVVKAQQCRGVHLGAKSGKTRGIVFGYSQFANPIYLSKKGTVPWARAVAQMCKNVLANLRGTLLREAGVDRRGRLQGNLLALVHLFKGRLHPCRVYELVETHR